MSDKATQVSEQDVRRAREVVEKLVAKYKNIDPLKFEWFNIAANLLAIEQVAVRRLALASPVATTADDPTTPQRSDPRVLHRGEFYDPKNIRALNQYLVPPRPTRDPT